jgi:transcriptional regulator with XRE-family HTH domain
MAADSNGRTVRQYLGAELGRLRRLAGIGGRELASRVGISQSKVSRIETGAAVPTMPEVEAWAVAVGASTEARDSLLRLTEAAHGDVQAWREAFEDDRASLQDETRAYEASARTIRNFHPAIVPGLLQTAEYTRHVLDAVNVDPEEMRSHDHAAAVAGRLRRQEALYDESRTFEFLMTEAALRWHSHDSGLVRPQLDRIRSVSTLRNVWIGIIPAGALVRGVPEHNFQLYEDRDDDRDPVVRIELVHARVTVTDPKDVAIYQQQFSRFRAVALDGDGARDFLTDLAADLNNGSEPDGIGGC